MEPEKKNLKSQPSVYEDDSTNPLSKNTINSGMPWPFPIKVFLMKDGIWTECNLRPDKGYFSIGAASEDDVRLSGNPEILREHIVIRPAGKAWFVFERGSGGLLKLNGIHRHQLMLSGQSSCVLQLGPVLFLLNCKSPAEYSAKIYSGAVFKAGTQSGAEKTFHSGSTVLIGSNRLCDIYIPGADFAAVIFNYSGLPAVYNIESGSFISADGRSTSMPSPLTGKTRIIIGSSQVNIDVPMKSAAFNLVPENGTFLKDASFMLMEINDVSPGKKHILPSNGHSIFLGRGSENYLTIENSKVSRRHAQLISSSNSVIIADCESTNGTFVNGERITRRIVFPGDIISFAEASYLLMYSE